MSNNPNNFSTLPKSNKSKSQKVDIDDQSALANLVITGLINNAVEYASTQISSSNNNNRSELQDKTKSELQELEQLKFKLESLEQLEPYE
ncbi:19465_t:CDS:1, partial [Gigaspora rosea]